VRNLKNENEMSFPTIIPKQKRRGPNNKAQMVKSSANTRTNFGFGSKESNNRQW
jgi:hypothetical protein